MAFVEPERLDLDRLRVPWLRNLALLGLADAYEVVRSRGVDKNALAGMTQTGGWLRAVGVTAGMHEIAQDDPEAPRKLAALASDPVALVEWRAGQVLDALQEINLLHADNSAGATERKMTSLGSAMDIMEAHAGYSALL